MRIKISEISDLVNIILTSGPWIILLIIIILICVYPEKVEKLSSMLSKLFASVSIKMEKSHISKDIQFKLNSFRKKVNKECKGLIPYKTEIKFVNPSSIRSEIIKHKDNKLLIIMKNRKNQDENFIKAALISTEKTLIPNARRYVDNLLMHSIDLQYVKNLILSNKKILINYFIDKCLGPELGKNNELEDNLRILQKLSDKGIFTRILLQELKDYGMKFYPELVKEKHYKEPKNFLVVLTELANKEHQVDINPNYKGDYIKVSIVLIGRPEVVFKPGGVDIGPYINWIFKCEDIGIKTIYLLALGKNIIATEQICKQLDLMPSRFYKVSDLNYNVMLNKKEIVAKCIRYYLLENQ